MKLSMVLNLICTVAFSANSFSQGQNFSMSLENAKVRDVFRSIEGQSTYRFFYNDELTDINRLVSMDVKDSKIEDVLAQLFTNTDISYTILENNLIVIAPKRAIQQQKVLGTVTDAATGEPLPGVSVKVEGTSIGTITDINGKYSLDAPKDATLSFSFMGFLTESFIASGSTLDVKLTADVKKLDEVVVIGYGVQRKEAVTGSVASIKGDIVRDVPTGNVTQALQGRIAGVEMQQTSSNPGASMQVRIRGTRSLAGQNDPLVVLDGIPFAGSISDITPSDIKSVDILKDASATAIYGSRGANGVVLITTNKGKKGQKAQITYDGYYGPKIVFAQFPMMNNTEFAALRKAANLYVNSTDEKDSINTNWQDLLYRTGSVQSHDLSMAGGTEKSAYMFGVNYYKEEAILPLKDYSRISLRSSLDQELGKYIKVGFTSNNAYAVNNGNGINVGGALTSTPLASPYNADGTYKRQIKMPMEDQWVYTRQSLNALGDGYIDQTVAFSSYNSIYGEVKIPYVEGLKYRANVGLNFRQSMGGYYQGQGVFNTTATTVSNASASNERTRNWTFENMLTYDHTFAKKHEVNAVALFSAEQSFYDRSKVTQTDIPVDAFQFYNLGRSADNPVVNPDDQWYNNTGLKSTMGRLMYSYDSRYMITASVRYDGSSRLAKGHNWTTYPAASVGWNINKEGFMKNVTVIDLLKLRAGYGVTANQSVNPYSTLGGLANKAYNFGSTNTFGYYVSDLPNPSLGWEYTKTMNYGIDFGILKNRLTGTVEYYDSKTTGLLYRLGLPPTSGVSGITSNIGSSENKGVEVSLNGVILDNPRGITWEAGLNIYTNENKLTALASLQNRDEANNWFVGYSINSIFDYKYVGLWQEGDAFMNDYDAQAKVGSIKVLYTGDYDATGKPTRLIGGADRQIMNMDPDFQGGFNTRISYKGFDLSVVGTFKSGGLVIATPYGANGYLNMLNGRRGNIKVDYYTSDNTGAKFPKPGGPVGDQPSYLNTLSYISASYMKIRTISLGYNFDKAPWFKVSGISKMRLYATVQNPFVFFSPYHDLSGMDPEPNSYGNEGAAVNLNYNLRRLLTIGNGTPASTNYIIGLSFTF